ncbi:MAG: Histidine kinaselike ATPase domain [Ilumatobacteraceae bacterium]|jgi:anti-sigma regulatory factor (Ser/Thr protein kinase)
MSQPARVPPDLLSRDYEGSLATLRLARRDVVDFLDQHGADEETKERAAIIVSELTSNAVQASPGFAYNIEVARVDDAVAISVRNRPEAGLPPPREEWRPAQDVTLVQLSPRGRGLAIVESLSEELTIQHEGDEVVITARLRLEAEPE